MSASLPTEADLQDLFDKLNPIEHGSMGIFKLRDAIAHLEKRYSFGLRPEDDKRLYSYLCNLHWREGEAPTKDTASGICREHFVAGMKRLSCALLQMKAQNGINVNQMKTLLTAAFDRFDKDQDGHISFEELTVATEHMGLQFQDGVLIEVYHFLVPDRKFKMTLENLASEQSSEQKRIEAMCRSLALLYKKKGIDGIVYLMGLMRKEFQAEGTLEDKAQRAWACAWDGLDHVCDVLQLGLDVAGVAVALRYLGETMAEQAQNHAAVGVDVGTVLPLVTLMGVAMVDTMKEINELVPREMSMDEAQLYSCVFRPRGFSQAEFRRLLSCPGFCWKTAEPGDLLHDGKHRLQILLRGSAEVGFGGQSAVLPVGSTLGETFFLHDRCLWDKETVVARDHVFGATWDQQKLRKHLAGDLELSMRLDQLLTEIMVANILKKAQFSEEERQRSVARPRSSATAKGLFEAMDTNQDGFLSTEEFNRASVLLGLSDSAMTKTNDAAMELVMGKDVCKERMDLMVPALCKRYDLDHDDESRRRLFAYFDINKDGIISAAEFKRKMAEMDECISSLKGLTMQEIESIMVRAFERFDANGDGVINETEFQQIREKLHLPLSTEQVQWLFSFFDVDKSGAIDYSASKAWAKGRLSWADALDKSWKEQVQRKGFAEFHALLGDLGSILTGPGDLVSKAHLVSAKFSDRSDTLAEMVSTGDDALGAGVALWGIWREVSGVSSWEDADDIGLTPFLLFLGLLGIKAVRCKAEGDFSSLTEAEAVLFATSFERNGFTVSEFQQLLKYGNARWEKVDAGDLISSSSCTSLKIIASGSCVVHYGGKASTAVGRGAIVGSSHFLDADLNQIAIAAESTMVLTLEKDALESHLAHNDSLALRFRRIVSKSMVDTFLGDVEEP